MDARSRVAARMGEDLAGPLPTGRRECAEGVDWLVLTREMKAPRDWVWALLTDPNEMRSWLGTWEPGGREGLVRVMLNGEDSYSVYEIYDSQPPRRLEIGLLGTHGDAAWVMHLELESHPGGTRLLLKQSLGDAALAPMVGASCEFYVDRLGDAAEGRELASLSYDDYFVGQADHYRQLFPVQRQSSSDPTLGPRGQ